MTTDIKANDIKSIIVDHYPKKMFEQLITKYVHAEVNDSAKTIKIIIDDLHFSDNADNFVMTTILYGCYIYKKEQLSVEDKYIDYIYTGYYVNTELNYYYLPNEISYETFKRHTYLVINEIITIINNSDNIDNADKILITNTDAQFSAFTTNNMQFGSTQPKITQFIVDNKKVRYTKNVESLHPSAVSIGDTNIWNYPISIAVREFNSIMPIPVMSPHGDAVTTNGQSTNQIEINYIFTEQEVNTKLRPLIAQFIKSPINLIECSFLKNVFYPTNEPLIEIPGFVTYMNPDKGESEMDNMVAYLGFKNSVADTGATKNAIDLGNLYYNDYIKNKEAQKEQTDTLLTASRYGELNIQELLTDTGTFKKYIDEYTNQNVIDEYTEENKEIEYNNIGISDTDKQVLIAQKSLNITSLPGYPYTYRVQLNMELSNVDIFGGAIGFLETIDDVGNAAIQKLIGTEEATKLLPVNITYDPGMSEPYIANYEHYMDTNLVPINREFNNGVIKFTYSYSDDVITDIIYKKMLTVIDKLHIVRQLMSSAKPEALLTNDQKNVFKKYFNDVGFFISEASGLLSKPFQELSQYVKIANDGNIQFYFADTAVNRTATEGSKVMILAPHYTEIKEQEYKDGVKALQDVNFKEFEGVDLDTAFKSYQSNIRAGFLTMGQMLITMTKVNDLKTYQNTLAYFESLLLDLKAETIINYKERVLEFHPDKLVTYIQVYNKNSVPRPESGSTNEYPISTISFAAGLANKLSTIPILGHTTPTHQMLGRTSWNGTFNLQTTSDGAYKEIVNMQKRTRQLLMYKQVIDLKPEQKLKHVTMSTEGDVFGLLGIKNVVISDVDYRTIEGMPGVKNITLNFMESAINRTVNEFEEFSDSSKDYVEEDEYLKFFGVMKEFFNSSVVSRIINSNIKPTLKPLKMGIYYNDESSNNQKLIDATFPSLKYFIETELINVTDYFDMIAHVDTFIKYLDLSFSSGFTGDSLDERNRYITVLPKNSMFVNGIRYLNNKLNTKIGYDAVHVNMNEMDIINSFGQNAVNKSSIDVFRIKEPGYLSILFGKYIKAKEDGIFDLFEGDPSILDMANTVLKDINITNVFQTANLGIHVGFDMVFGTVTGPVKKVVDNLSAILQLLEIQQMTKTILNTPVMWHNIELEILDIIAEYPDMKDIGESLYNLLMNLEQKRYRSSYDIARMYDLEDLPISGIHYFKPNFNLLYHPTFYLYNDPNMFTKNGINDFYNLMTTQNKILINFYKQQLIDTMEKCQNYTSSENTKINELYSVAINELKSLSTIKNTDEGTATPYINLVGNPEDFDINKTIMSKRIVDGIPIFNFIDLTTTWNTSSKNPNRTDQQVRGNVIDTLVIHCTESDDDRGSNYKDIISNSFTKSDPNANVPYHYMIELIDGQVTLIKTLPHEILGQHARNINNRSLGISLIKKEKQEITDKEYQTLILLLSVLCDMYNIHPKTGIFFHRNIALSGWKEKNKTVIINKTCPGVIQKNKGLIQIRTDVLNKMTKNIEYKAFDVSTYKTTTTYPGEEFITSDTLKKATGITTKQPSGYVQNTEDVKKIQENAIQKYTVELIKYATTNTIKVKYE